MPNQNGMFDVEFLERGMQQGRLNFDRDVSVIWPIAVAMAGAIECERAIARREWSIQTRPVLARTRITMNQDDGTTSAFDHKMKSRAFDGNEF